MKLQNRFVLLAGWFLLMLIFFGLSTADSQDLGNSGVPLEPGKGAIVDAVKKDSEADRTGLQDGDVLLNWTRGDSKGKIESPFDLLEVEIEQAPRGTVTLEGSRALEKRAWTLGSRAWGIVTRPNLPKDLLIIYMEGQKLADAGKLQDAVERWRFAAVKAQETEADLTWLGSWFLFHAGELLGNDQRWNEADAAYREAIARSDAAGSAIKVHLLRGWAAAFQSHDDWPNAEKHYEEAADESRKSSIETLVLADTLDDISVAAWQRGELDKAEKGFSEALKIQQRLAPGSLNQAKTLSGLGLVAWRRGNLAMAGQYHFQALEIREKLDPGSLNVANSLNSLGVVASERGDLATTEDYLHQALVIQEKIVPDSLHVAKSFNNLGLLAEERDDLAKAEEYLYKSLAINERLAPGSLDVAVNFLNLGIVMRLRGDLDKAEGYSRQALMIEEKIAPGSLDMAEGFHNLGEISWDRRDLAKAEDYHAQALAIQEKLAPGSLEVAASLTELANVVRDRGDTGGAQEYYRQALPIWQKLAPERKEYAEALAAFAGLMQEQQQFDAASLLFERALNVLESQTIHLGGSDEVRSNFRAKYLGYYQAYIDLLIQQKRPELAFQVLERSRARTLLEMLAAAHVDVRKESDPALLARERSLEADITEKSNSRIRLQSGKHTEEQIAAINREIEKLFAEHKDVEEQIRVSSPGYAALTQPRPLSATEVQQQLLDADTLLLEYSLGEKHSYVWAVTRQSLMAYELPKRTEIESAARWVYGLLTARNSMIQGESASQKRARLARAEAEYPEAIAALSRMVLAPIGVQLKGKRLLTVSDGALQYIPFEILPEPESPGKRAASSSFNQPPLVVEHEIVNLPSASVLAVLRRDQIGRAEAAKAVAVLADPVFNQNDERVSAAIRKQNRGSAETFGEKQDRLPLWSSEHLMRSVADVGLSANGNYLPRLRFTRREAEAIMAVIPAGQGMEALDFRASRKTATSPEMAQYRIVHFATHGLLDSEHPELSGLVLSLVDERGKQQNGFLQLQDIYNLNLTADLVVLSACETGLGKQVQGEGLIGLTRGFMNAGALRVMASLWKVDDVATADLMQRFYKAMEKDGMSPAAALRQAQIEMWKQRDWRFPYYWAAFQMQGEWK